MITKVILIMMMTLFDNELICVNAGVKVKALVTVGTSGANGSGNGNVHGNGKGNRNGNAQEKYIGKL